MSLNWPIVLIVGTTVSIGAWMGWRYIMGVRNHRALVMVHFLLGAAALEVMAVILRGAPNGEVMPATEVAKWAAGLMTAALLTGVLAPIIAQSSPRKVGPVLAVHAGVATLAFGTLLVWAIQS